MSHKHNEGLDAPSLTLQHVKEEQRRVHSIPPPRNPPTLVTSSLDGVLACCWSGAVSLSVPFQKAVCTSRITSFSSLLSQTNPLCLKFHSLQKQVDAMALPPSQQKPPSRP